MEFTKADEIASVLEEAIATGTIPSGTVLRQEQISRDFQVSRTPTREALRRLAALGLAEFLPNRGVRVRSLDRGQWHEIYLVRAALEGLAASMAASVITDQQLEVLKEAEAAFAACTNALRRELTDSEREAATYDWLQANVRFHDVILQASGSELVDRLARSVRRAFAGRSIWRPASEIDALYEQMVRQHTAIRDALVARSPRGASELSSEHVLNSWTLLEHILDETSDRRPQRRSM
ncbi:MAG: GntR family transcriptional regulator [Candidatus Dormiibacterota bacterium]